MKFPRIVWAGGFSKKAIMTHTQVNSKEQYLRFIRLNNNRMNCYTNTYDYRDFQNGLGVPESAILDKVFLDLDAHDEQENLEECFRDLCSLRDYIRENDYQHEINFSGRGFHVFIYGLETSDFANIQEYHKQINAMLKSKRADGSDTTLDSNVVQVTRLRRIANTVNMKASYDGGCYYCIPLTLTDVDSGLDYILELAKKPNKLPSSRSGQRVRFPKALPFEERYAPSDSITHVDLGDNVAYPMIPCLWSACHVENPPHEARVYFIQWIRDIMSDGERQVSPEMRQNIKQTALNIIEDIYNEGEVWLDFDKATSAHHVDFIVKKGYNAPSCRTLIAKGYCVGKCWRYPIKKGEE